MLGLEAEDGVGAEAVAEHDGRAGHVGLGDGDAQRLLEPLGADVQLRLELVAVDALDGAVGELAEDGRAGDELEAARPSLGVVHQLAASSAASAIALTLASGASTGMSQPDCRMRPVGPMSAISLLQ